MRKKVTDYGFMMADSIVAIGVMLILASTVIGGAWFAAKTKSNDLNTQDTSLELVTAINDYKYKHNGNLDAITWAKIVDEGFTLPEGVNIVICPNYTNTQPDLGQYTFTVAPPAGEEGDTYGFKSRNNTAPTVISGEYAMCPEAEQITPAS